MTEWIAATATARGRHHEQAGQPNEDDAVATADGPVATAAVADGHGAGRYTRADRGARLATSAMATLLADPPDDLDELPRRLVRRWRDAVDDDVERDPPAGPRPHERYGTTALGARLDHDRLLLVQLGDGDILLADADGQAHHPVPAVEAPFPGATDSLVQQDAAARVRLVELADTEPRLVLLASDGLQAAAGGGPRWWADVVDELVEDLGGRRPDDVPALLDERCRAGAATGGDDTTVAALVHPALLAGT